MSVVHILKGTTRTTRTRVMKTIKSFDISDSDLIVRLTPRMAAMMAAMMTTMMTTIMKTMMTTMMMTMMMKTMMTR